MDARLFVILAALLAGGPHPSLAAEPSAATLDALPADQRATVAAWAKRAFCHCGCPHTVDQCLREHATCRHAPRMVRLAARLVRAGAKEQDLERSLDGYYASFDRRAKLDVTRFGPPLGNPDAPVTMVEFSDFTCPYCALVRPILEAFVKARAERVKLYYKPFPIESHPGALEAAQAGEWARERGIFWPMHDAIFEERAHSVEELADLARAAGGDPADLREAVAEKRHLARIRESQAEARAAGIRGTPTVFLGGRMLLLSDFSEEGLEQALEDEEEWQRRGGWERD